MILVALQKRLQTETKRKHEEDSLHLEVLKRNLMINHPEKGGS